MLNKPEQMADEVRRAIWGVDRIPVDPVTIAKKLGIEVYETVLPDTVSGAIIKEKGKDARILVQANDTDNRKRFTVAHEIGHFIANSDSGEDTFEYVDLRDTESSEGNNPKEVFANKFAAELLMPQDLVKQAFRSTQSVSLLAAQFGVSAEAMRFRLKNLGLLREQLQAAS